MMPAQSGTDAGIWTVPGHAPVIEYSRSLLGEIVTHVCDAYESYLGGGVEVGGVLFGHRDRFHLRILAFRPLVIKPPRPSFVLSESDSQRLDELIRSASSDPGLEGMVAVGWYHSHTRSEVFLSEGDLELYSRHFPELWQIAMVLHPSEFEPVRIGFFFRESDGFVRTDQSYQEFAVDAPPRTRLLRKSPPWKLDDHGHPEEPPLELSTPVAVETYELAPEPAAPPRILRLRKWALLVVALVAVAAGSYSVWTMQKPSGTLGLRASAVANELHLRWNGNSPAIRDAEHLELTLVDGGQSNTVALPLKPGAKASYVYKPKTSRVDVILKSSAGWGHTMQERITFLAHPSLNQPPPELQEAQRAEAEVNSEVQALRDQLQRQQEETKRLEATLAEARDKLQKEQSRRQEELLRAEAQKVEAQKIEAAKREAALRRAAESPKPAPPKSAPSEVALRSPGQSASQMPAPVQVQTPAPVAPPKAVATTPPTVSAQALPPTTNPPASNPPVPRAAESAQTRGVPAAPTPAPTAPAPAGIPATTPVRPPAPAASSVAPVPAPVRPTQATSGRLLWVGTLPKGAELIIQGRKPSRGSLVGGELPAGPVRVGAYPAELGSNFLRVFTTNPALGVKPRVEGPSASNGWNTTEYVYDPKSVNQVIVEKTPASPGASALTLRAGSRKVSVIVIEWQIANP